MSRVIEFCSKSKPMLPHELAQDREVFLDSVVVAHLDGPVGEALFEDARTKAQNEGADSHWSLL